MTTCSNESEKYFKYLPGTFQCSFVDTSLTHFWSMFPFYTFYLCFQGVQNGNIGLKWVNSSLSLSQNSAKIFPNALVQRRLQATVSRKQIFTFLFSVLITVFFSFVYFHLLSRNYTYACYYFYVFHFYSKNFEI